MAQTEEVIIKLTTDIGDLKEELETVKKGVEGIGENTKKTEEETSGLAKGLKKLGTSFGNLAKASGIVFILQKAFEVLVDVFKQNQKAVDLFNTAFEFVSIAMNDFVNFLFGNVGNVVQVFKDFFENPKEKLKEFASSIKDGIIVRFEQLLEVFGLVGKAVGQLFKGDFKGAAKTAKEAGKELVDVYTGVDKSFDEVAAKVKKYTLATFESAKSNVALAKSAKVAAAALQGVIERYDAASERQRQLRDDETASFEARIAANDMLGATLEAQFVEMTKLAELRVRAAQADYDKLQNDENLIALMEAKNELSAVEATIMGFRSEQLTNQVSLEKELGEVKNQLFLEGLSAREREIAEVEAHYDEQFKLAKRANEKTEDLEKRKAEAIMKIRAAQLQADMDLTAATLGGIASAFGEHTAAYKAIKIVETTISTYTSAQKAFESASSIPIVGSLLAPIAAGAAVAAGMQNIARITAVQPPEMSESSFASGGLVGGIGTGTSDSVRARLSRGESVINARSTRMFSPLLSQINQAGGGKPFDDGGTLEQDSAGMTAGVLKAYVVTDEMTNSQDRLNKIRRKATI